MLVNVAQLGVLSAIVAILAAVAGAAAGALLAGALRPEAAVINT